MVCDHAGLILFQEKYLSLHLLGRAAFPLFCYALAVAFLKAGPDKGLHYGFHKYGLRLLIFAVIAEPVSLLTRGLPVLNILFTLCLAAGFAGLSWRMKNWQIYICYAVAIATLLFPPLFEFGWIGVALPSCIMLAMRGEKTAVPFLLLFLFLMNMQGWTAGILPLGDMSVERFLMMAAMTGAAASLVPLAAIMAGSLMPQAGRLTPKYFLHIFYPAHLALLLLLAKLMNEG